MVGICSAVHGRILDFGVFFAAMKERSLKLCWLVNIHSSFSDFDLFSRPQLHWNVKLKKNFSPDKIIFRCDLLSGSA